MKRIVLAVIFAAFAAFADNDGVQPRVSITSQPSGATVIVDGKDRGTTPVTIFDLAPGLHHIKFRLSGYCERDRFFSMDEGPFIERNEVMVPEMGLLLLKTEPEGCDIQIDGVSVGRTPRLITDLPMKGVYSVRFRKAGYQDQTISVKFDGRKPLVREEVMILASGRIKVESEPMGAEVSVNGVVRGNTPVTVSDIPKGRATVKLRLPGFENEVRELAVNAGDEQTLSVMMKGLPGTLRLSSVPEGARFYVNGESHGKGPLSLTGLKPGNYEVRVELEGYGTVTRTLTLANGGAINEEFKLSNMMGRIEVRTSPADAQVVLDGKLRGTTKRAGTDDDASAVFVIDNVLEGEHTLIVRKEGYAEVVRHPTVANSKIAKQNVKLKRVFTPNVELETTRGTYRGVLISKNSETVVIEVSLGIQRTFPIGEIRKMNFLTSDRHGD